MDVIIIGKGQGRTNAPLDGETWGVNDLILHRPVKLLFLMHRGNIKYGSSGDAFNVVMQRRVIAKINELKTPVITIEDDGLLPDVIIYPLAEMAFKYFTNSISYMIAYAIYKDAKSIELYGVPMLVDEEFNWQRPCVEYWLGVANGRGIPVTVNGSGLIFSSKLEDNLYGYNGLKSP